MAEELQTYTVVAHDNPSKIARKFGISPELLQSHNGIDDPTKMQLGQVLTIPPKLPEPPEPQWHTEGGDFERYASIVGSRESRDNTKETYKKYGFAPLDKDQVNSLGYTGQYQMGGSALSAGNYLTKAAIKKMVAWGESNKDKQNAYILKPEAWRGTNGINNIEDFKDSFAAQTDAFKQFTKSNEKYLRKWGIITDETDPKVAFSHMMGAHIAGGPGYRKNPAASDSMGTTGTEYQQHIINNWDAWEAKEEWEAMQSGEGYTPEVLAAAQKLHNARKKTYNDVESHTIVAGDELGKLSKKYLGNTKRWKEIQALNEMEGTGLEIGQIIKLPVEEAPAPDEIPYGSSKYKGIVIGGERGTPMPPPAGEEIQYDSLEDPEGNITQVPHQETVTFEDYDSPDEAPEEKTERLHDESILNDLMGEVPIEEVTEVPRDPNMMSLDQEGVEGLAVPEEGGFAPPTVIEEPYTPREDVPLSEGTLYEASTGVGDDTVSNLVSDLHRPAMAAGDHFDDKVPQEDPTQNQTVADVQESEWEDLSTAESDEWEDLSVDSEWEDLSTASEPTVSNTPDYSIAETVALHSAQGTTFGTSETITGGAYAIEQMMTGENAHRSFGEAFEVGREAAKEMNRESAKQNPVTATTTDIGSGIATSILLPGSGLLKAKGAVATAKAVGAGAAEGAVAGLGYSQDGEELFGAGLGGAFGAGGTLVMKGAGKGWRWYKGEELTKELAEQAYETGSAQLAKRVDEKMYGSNSTDTIHYGALGEDMDIESLLLTDNPRVFRAELEKIKIPDIDSSYDLLSRNVKYDSKKYGLDYNKQLKEMQQVADDKAYQDLGETGVGDAVDLSGAEPHIVYTPQDITAINTMAVFRAESVSFMRYVTNADARASAKNFVGKGYVPPTSSSADQIGELVGEFRKAQKAGLADESAYRAFRLHKYTLESARDIKSEWISKKSRELMESDGYRREDAIQSARMEFKETLGKDISERERKFLENNFMFREIDRTTKGMDTEMLQNQAYRHGLMKDFFETKVLVEVRKATKAIRKSKYSESDIHLMMTRAELGELKIPSDARQAVAAVTKATKFVREASESLGLKIGDKGDFYVPKRRLQGAEYVHALTEFYNSKVQGAKGTLGDLIRSTVDKTDQEVEQMIKLVSRDKAEMIGFVQEMRRVVDGDLNVASIDSIFRSGSLQSGTLKKVVKELDANALHTRNDILPEFIIDRNLGRSLLKNVTEAGDLIFMEPVGRLLDGRAQILRGLGKDNASEAVMNFRRDITGQARKSKLSSTYDWVDKMKMKYGSKPVSAALDFYEMSVSAIYPNLVGGNPASVVRNLTQVITKTIPEMGMWSPRKIASAYGSALDQLRTTEGREALKRAGIISSDRSGLISEIGSTSVLTDSALANFQRSWNNFSMMAFNASDDLNRVVTAELALDISTAIVKKDPKALKYIDKLPPAIKSKALRIFRSDGYEIIDKRGFEIAIRDHFEVQTQIAYGKIGNSEFVRDNGRLFSMMTKWPIQVGSDIYSMTKQRKFISRFTQKYFGPLVLANMAAHQVKDAVGDDEELDAKTKFFLGNQYGGNFTGLSALSGPSALSPALTGMFAGVQGGGDMIEGLLYDDERAMRKGVKGVTGGVMQYVPVVGGGFKMYDRVQRGFYGDSPRLDNLLLSDEYDYDY